MSRTCLPGCDDAAQVPVLARVLWDPARGDYAAAAARRRVIGPESKRAPHVDLDKALRREAYVAAGLRIARELALSALIALAILAFFAGATILAEKALPTPTAAQEAAK